MVQAGLVLAVVTGLALLTLPLAAVVGAPPLGLAVALVAALALAGLACAIAALVRQEAKAVAPLVTILLLVGLPLVGFGVFWLFPFEPN